MDEQSQQITPKKEGIDPIAVGAGIAAGSAAAWGAVEVAKDIVVKNYQALRSQYINTNAEAKDAMVKITDEQRKVLEDKADELYELLAKQAKKLGKTETAAIAAVTFIGVGLLVTAAVHTLQHREQPDAVINPASIELAQQKIVSDTPDKPAFVKQ
jgi:nucleotide-binding universal stress UspA family protein